MIETLKSIGYVEGVNLFGAGYDWKNTLSDNYLKELQVLIEKAVKSTGSKAVLITHSMGCPFSYYFLRRMGDDWVQQNIHMYIPIAPAWMGAVKALDMMLMGLDNSFPIAGKFFAPLMRHIPSIYFLLPKAEAFPNMVVASTPSKNYTFENLADILIDGNITDARDRIYAARWQFDKYCNNYEEPPPVPVRGFVANGKNTVIKLEFAKDFQPHGPDGDWEDVKNRQYEDGDGTVPLRAALYALEKWKNAGHDVEVQIFVAKDGHVGILKDPELVEKVIEQFCE